VSSEERAGMVRREPAPWLSRKGGGPWVSGGVRPVNPWMGGPGLGPPPPPQGYSPSVVPTGNGGPWRGARGLRRSDREEADSEGREMDRGQRAARTGRDVAGGAGARPPLGGPGAAGNRIACSNFGGVVAGVELGRDNVTPCPLERRGIYCSVSSFGVGAPGGKRPKPAAGWVG